MESYTLHIFQRQPNGQLSPKQEQRTFDKSELRSSLIENLDWDSGIECVVAYSSTGPVEVVQLADVPGAASRTTAGA